MSTDAIIGCVLIAVSFGAMLYLVLWSRAYIERIARGGYRSARRIQREEHDE